MVIIKKKFGYDKKKTKLIEQLLSDGFPLRSVDFYVLCHLYRVHVIYRFLVRFSMGIEGVRI